MKKIITILLLTMGLSISTKIIAQTNIFPSAGAAGIGTTTPDACSLLEVKSTTQGILIPRMTLTQRNAIVSPATGLMIFQTNSTPGFYYYSGTAWTAVSPKGANRNLSNLAIPTALNVDLLPLSNNTISLGSASLKYKDINLYNLKFADGSVQTTAAAYTAGSGIDISGMVITNTKPTQWTTSGNNIVFAGGDAL